MIFTLAAIWFAVAATLALVSLAIPGATKFRVEAQLWHRDIHPAWIEWPVATIYFGLPPLLLLAWWMNRKKAAPVLAQQVAPDPNSNLYAMAKAQNNADMHVKEADHGSV